MKYDCDLIKDLLPLYEDQALSQASSIIVETHLETCESCHQYYKQVKNTAQMSFELLEEKIANRDYFNIAKKLRRTKWYWRLLVASILSVTIYLSLMYSEGNRFDAISAADASHMIGTHAEPLATVNMGNERVLYIYEDEGIYQGIDVKRNFPYWKYVQTWPSRYIVDSEAELQLIMGKTYGNSIRKSLYKVYAVGVKDKRVAMIELGKEGALQKQKVNSKVTVFYWDETGKWDGTNTWEGMINRGELKGIAYDKEGNILYNLILETTDNGRDRYKWVPKNE